MAKEFFNYYVESTHKVFPIDYSLHEFDSKHKKNIHRAMNVVEHPLLKAALMDLIWPDGHNHSNYTIGGIYPLPVEAETFLRCFYALIDRKEYKSTPQKPKELVGTALGQKFSKELCQDIIKSIFAAEPDKHYDDAAYCRRSLCQEDSFCRIAMDDLWEKELGTRIKQIRQLAANVSPVQQAYLLQNVLLTLDEMCLNLIQSSENEEKNYSTAPPSPDRLLKKLLSNRCKIPFKGENATYKIKNAPIKMPQNTKNRVCDLKTAFMQLENHRVAHGPLMAEARHAYLSNLEGMVAQSPFETQYLELQRYVDVVSDTPDLIKLEQLFTDAMKKLCGYEIDRMMRMFKNEPEPIPQMRYLDRLIYDAARSRAYQGMQCFGDAFQLVQMCSTMADSGNKLKEVYTRIYIPADQGETSVNKAEITPYVKRKYYFENLQAFFVRYWAFAGHTDPAIDKTRCFVDIENIANEFSAGAQDAARFLGKGEDLVRTAEDTLELLRFCEDSVVGADAKMPAHAIADISFSVLAMAILQVLQRIVMDGVSGLLKDFPILQRVQKQVQESTQKK